MWYWITLLVLSTLIMLGLSYWLYRNSRRYEQMRLRDVLSEEMKLTLRNERTANKNRKIQFEKLLKQAGKPEIPAGEKKSPGSP